MKTEENLNRLFADLKSEKASTSHAEISMWLESASVVTSSAHIPLSLKIKSILMAKTGWVILTALLTFAGISTYLIFGTDTKVRTMKNNASRYFVPEPLTKTDPVELSLKKKVKTKQNIKENGKDAETDLAMNYVNPPVLHPFSLKQANPLQNLVMLAAVNDSKDWAGVYKSYADFSAGKFCDSIEINVGKNKIYVSSFDRLIVKTESRKTIYKLGSVYGFYNGKNLLRYGETTSALKDYGYFTVQETNGLILYTQIQTGYKGTQHTSFFYSATLNSQIKKLNVKNLNLDFPNIQFIDVVSRDIERLTNMGPEKWRVTLKEINSAYRKYYQ